MGSVNLTSSLENVTNGNSTVNNIIAVTFGALILSIVFLLGVPGNLFIIWSIMAVFQYTLETVVGFLVPCVIIVSSYVCILRRLRQTMFKRRIRSENLIQAIIVTFFIFWLPYHCVNIVQVAAALTSDETLKSRLDNFWKSSRAVTSALAFISSCANPVLYAFAGRSYIKADGLAFIARLFEGTVLDYGARRNHQNRDVIRL